MNERIAHWKKVNTKLKPPTSIETIKPTKFYQARGANAHANGDVELPPAAVTIDSDESWCSDDSAPFPLPLEQLNKYPAEQRKQQQEQNRFYNFFERYALEVSEAGVGLCSSSGKVDDRTANTVTDADVDADGDVNESMRHISIFDDSSVCAEDASGSNAANGSTTPGSTGEKKGVRWDPNLVSCNAVDYGDFYDRYMLVVTEVGASACGSKEATTSGGDQAGPAVALEKKNSPTSTTETDQVDVDYSKEQVESSQEEEWSPNQANCTEIDMCVDMARAVPFNLNKFWESLAVQNRCDEVDDVDDADQVQTRKQNPKRRKAREVSSSTFSREVRCFTFVTALLHCHLDPSLSLSPRVSFIQLTNTPPVHFTSLHFILN